MRSFYFILFILQTSNVKTCRSYYKQNVDFIGTLFTQNIIQHYSNVAKFAECVKYCKMHHCMSFAIETDSGLCRLYSTILDSGSAAVSQDEVTYYYQWSDTCLGWRMTCNPQSTGVFNISRRLAQIPYTVLCDMDIDDGGWTVLQNRFDGSLSFNKTWKQYQQTFGNFTGELWLGLDVSKLLCHDQMCEARIDLEDWQGVQKFAMYSKFRVGWYGQQYQLTVEGYSGTAGDSIGCLHGMKFSTFDTDLDLDNNTNCAELGQAGWWYKDCGQCNLNGRYMTDDGTEDNTAMTWWTFHGSYRPLKTSRMMLRAIYPN